MTKDLNIIVKSVAKNDLISGTFNNEKLETVLDALKMQYRINYAMDKDRVIILSRK